MQRGMRTPSDCFPVNGPHSILQLLQGRESEVLHALAVCLGCLKIFRQCPRLAGTIF